MTFLNRLLSYLAAACLVVLTAWLLISFHAGRSDYLALARGGLLLVGLGTCIYGVLWLRSQIAMLGLVFMGLGFLSFFLMSPPSPASPDAHDLVNQVSRGFHHPLSPSGSVLLGHATIAAFLVLNGILLSQRADLHRFAGGNLILAAFVLITALLCG